MRVCRFVRHDRYAHIRDIRGTATIWSLTDNHGQVASDLRTPGTAGDNLCRLFDDQWRDDG